MEYESIGLVLCESPAILRGNVYIFLWSDKKKVSNSLSIPNRFTAVLNLSQQRKLRH